MSRWDDVRLEFQSYTNWTRRDFYAIQYDIRSWAQDESFRKRSVLDDFQVSHGTASIDLPTDSTALIRNFSSRAPSSLVFSDVPVRFDDFCYVILNSLGTITDTAASCRGRSGRAYPSAGAIYGVNSYIILNSVDGLASGIYLFDKSNNKLISMPKNSFDDITQALNITADCFRNISFVTLHVVHASKYRAKYGERGYRFALLEAGHIVQCLLSSAHESNLSSCCWGGYIDDEINVELDLDGFESWVAHAVCFGSRPA